VRRRIARPRVPGAAAAGADGLTRAAETSLGGIGRNAGAAFTAGAVGRATIAENSRRARGAGAKKKNGREAQEAHEKNVAPRKEHQTEPGPLLTAIASSCPSLNGAV
jgi:hypothetical protein